MSNNHDENFLNNYLKKYGYMSDVEGYKPTTTQERDFILNYLEETGRAPASYEISRWRREQPNQLGWTFTEESPHYKKGFRTWQDYNQAIQRGEPYGAYTGSRVPEGGTVVLDEEGRPFFRTFRPEHWGAVMGGDRQFIPQTPTGQWTQEEIDKHYPTYPSEIPGSQTPDEIFSTVFAPSQVYGARLTDYLNELVKRDTPLIEEAITEAENRQNSLIEGYNEYQAQLEGMMSQGLMTEDDAIAALNFQLDKLQPAYDKIAADLEAQLENLWSEEKMQETLNQAGEIIGGGVYDETLPFFNEVQGVLGAETNKLLNFGLQQMEAIEKERIESTPKFEGYDRQQVQRPVTTGREKADYYEFVDTVNSQPYKEFLSGRFEHYLNMWIDSGQTDIEFIQWLLQFFAGG